MRHCIRSFFLCLNRGGKGFVQFHKGSGSGSGKNVLTVPMYPGLCHHADKGSAEIRNPYMIFYRISQKNGLKKGCGQIDGRNLMLLGIIMAGQSEGYIKAGHQNPAMQTAAGVQLPRHNLEGNTGGLLFKIAGNKMRLQMHKHTFIGNGVVGVSQLRKPLLHIFLRGNFFF